MSSKNDEQYARDGLGVAAEATAWCRIDAIPEPPRDVWRAAGEGPLRPGRIRPLGMLGVALAAPFKIFVPLIWVLERLNNLIYGDRTTLRLEREAEARRERAYAQHGLAEVFDGDWNGAAGQFLLRWYGQSSHPTRLVILAPGRVVLAGPPRRVTVGRLQKSRVLAELPADEAVLEDPLRGEERKSDRLLLRFADGTWLTLISEDGATTDLHWKLWGLERPNHRAMDILRGED